MIEEVEPLLIPMRGRMLHALDGQLTFVPYGQRPHEVIYSVSRPGSTASCSITRSADGVSPKFLHAARATDFDRDELTMLHEVTGDPQRLRMRRWSAPTARARSCGAR